MFSTASSASVSFSPASDFSAMASMVGVDEPAIPIPGADVTAAPTLGVPDPSPSPSPSSLCARSNISNRSRDNIFPARNASTASTTSRSSRESLRPSACFANARANAFIGAFVGAGAGVSPPGRLITLDAHVDGVEEGVGDGLPLEARGGGIDGLHLE